MSHQDRIAIVGIGGIFPDASDPDLFWENILEGRSAARKVPANRWTLSPEDAYHPTLSPDQVYSQHACLIDSSPVCAGFPSTLDPMCHLGLYAGQQAWDDAQTQGIDRQRAGVIIGNIALPTDGASAWSDHILGPKFAGRLSNAMQKKLTWKLSAASAPDAMNRFVAGLSGGLLAESLGLGGGAHTLDAACASSLYALKYAADELLRGRADIMLAGGLSRPDCLYTQMGFSQLRALSPSGQCSPFDENADGLVVGEGAGIVVLKRLADALAADDHIYAVLGGIGLSNDIGGNLMLPDSEGQLRAMREAYRQANWNPSDIDLIECHGTGTPIGDAVEFNSLQQLWGQESGRCVIGSVKSNVGHLLTGAGAAGLIKTLLAMKHGILPPTAQFNRLQPKLAGANSPFEVLSQPRDASNKSFRAAVSAFGFGGINAHVLLEPCEVASKTSMVKPQLDEPAVAVVGMESHFGSLENTAALARQFFGQSTEQVDGTIDEVVVAMGRFRIPPTELADMLPQQLLMLQTAANALADAGTEQHDGPRLDTGVFIGIGLDLNTTNFHFRWDLLNQARRWAKELNLTKTQLEEWTGALRDAASSPLSANRTMGALGGIVASRIARAFQIGGPSFTISSEQTSGLHALEQAVRALQRGELNVAVVGAVDLAGDERLQTGDDACDGAACLILKRLDDARRDGDRVYGVVAGCGRSTLDTQAAIEQASTQAGVSEMDCFACDARPTLGDAGMAGGLASVVQGCLALHHQMRGDQYWLHDQADGPRYASIIQSSVDHNHAAVILREADIAISPKPQTQTRQLRNSRKLDGEIAFVFPGAGNQFANMGQTLARTFPHVLQAQHRDNQRLKSQFAQGQFWDGTRLNQITHKDMIFGQVWLGAMVSDIVQSCGIHPEAIIGYSLGETTGLFASGCWTERDEMLKRMNESTLFSTDLAGPCNAVRQAWGLTEKDPDVRWRVVIVPCAVDEVNKVIADFDRVYLLINNTPGECVIGGDDDQLKQVCAQLKVAAHRVRGITAVHCEVAYSVREAYRNLHVMKTTPIENLRFYSGIWGKAYELTAANAADSILGKAMAPFDYTQVIEQAYADGVRYFLEMGPGASCSRMIGRILGDRPHVALSACKKEGLDDLKAMFAMLKEHGMAVDDSMLEAPSNISAAPAKKAVRVKVRRTEFENVPTPVVVPVVEPVAELAGSSVVVPPMVSSSDAQVSLPAATLAEVAVGVPVAGVDHAPVVTGAVAAQMAHAQAQQTFMQFSQQVTQTLGRTIQWQLQMLGQGGDPTLRPPGGTSEFGFEEQAVASQVAYASAETTGVPSVPSENFPGVKQSPGESFRGLDRGQCMTFAIGKVGDVLGPSFAPIDAHRTRVRLPDEPLMLVDRIVEIQGEALSMTHGRVVTEHDILPGAWYLDGDRIPTCIAVEAGQADLFLSGYLGIDFQTQGHAVYRLLDAVVTFHEALPGPGQTIRYDIVIDHFFQQGETYLFKFHFEATVNGRLFLTMREGCAGFFTQEELDAGQGVIQTKMDLQSMPGKKPADWVDLVAISGRESYDDVQLNALRRGDLAGCFGSVFANLNLSSPMGLPSGRMTLVHRILDLDPTGGRFGLGKIVGEADIHPDDWFLTCHFSDDPVMPGTLMYECCLHTLRVLLLRMGWVGESNEFVYEPIAEVAGQLQCRGQVLETTQKVWYEISVKELGYAEGDSEGTTGGDSGGGMPYVIADALMYADGKPVVRMKNMSLQLTGLTREGVESFWQGKDVSSGQVVYEGPVSPASGRPVLFDRDRILAFAEGKPSDAFGDRYEVFDSERRIARLPRPPYAFMDRVVSIADCEPWVLASGGVIEAEYDVPVDAWYFAADRQAQMPFAVLLEVALQPCGWLAGYLGSALTSDIDLSFRNLGGSAVQSLAVTADTGTLTTRIKITNVSQSVGMIIQNYEMLVTCSAGEVYRGTTYFGFFSKAALADQVGIRDITLYEPPALASGGNSGALPGGAFDYPTQAPYPDDQMRMLDRIEVFDPTGGPHGLGFVRGTMAVNPDRWFFQAHFYQDPVCPGSLGLESFMQLLKVVAVKRWNAAPQAQFQVMTLGQKHGWVYRGQVIPKDRQVMTQAVITNIDDTTGTITADGFLTVDGRIIYQMNDFALTMTRS